MYHLSIGITTNMKTKTTRWISENADSLGAHSIWIGEDIGIGQDVFVLTASAISYTEKTRVGTAIIPISTRNIATLARAGLSLHDISNGRFVFGTGIGGIQDLKRAGIVIKRPVTALREGVMTLRDLWAGKNVTKETELFNLEGYDLRAKTPVDIPVFLGVRGPQMLRLTGQIADGVILSGPLDYLRYAVNEIDIAAKKAGRRGEDIEKVAWLPTIPTFKGGKRSLAKKVVAIVVSDTPKQVLDMLSIDQEKINKLRDTVAREGSDEGSSLVDEELIDTFAIAGECNHMVDMFEKISKLGISEIVLGPPFSGDWRSAMQDIFAEVYSRRR